MKAGGTLTFRHLDNERLCETNAEIRTISRIINKEESPRDHENFQRLGKIARSDS
jgi:hypothetical protein